MRRFFPKKRHFSKLNIPGFSVKNWQKLTKSWPFLAKIWKKLLKSTKNALSFREKKVPFNLENCHFFQKF